MNKVTAVAIFLATIVIGSAAWNYTHQPQYPLEGFIIILTKDDSRLLTEADIKSYNATSYTLTLTTECADKMRTMRDPLIGDFSIIVDGEEDLHEIFVPSFISRSYPSSEVVIVYPSFDSDYMIMKIQMGYPWDQPSGYDPRQYSKMIQHFDKNGKLTR
ncbi:hypothetical protein MUP51_09450 [Candidatus Bathyarchaeota archaeon]|nr:hypothetical protein [Candidatus Bathyarchaeota archaeon]